MPSQYGLFVIANSAPQALTYRIPEAGQPELVPGDMVFLTLGRRKQMKIGLFLDFTPKPTEFECVDILGLLDPKVRLPEICLKLWLWITSYYLTPQGVSAHCVAPGFVWKLDNAEKRQKRLEKWKLDALGQGVLHGEKKQLTQEQHGALAHCLQAQQPVVLHGATGSGKTEVYIHAISEVLQGGKNALVLLPEIALTPLMQKRFEEVFKEDLQVVHSGMASGAYEKAWFAILRGKCRIVLGVRSAVFAPLQNVGLIIVDEEHESSYKSERMPCYHARDVAVKRGGLEKAKVILGSATPSLETFQNVHAGKYSYCELKSQFSGNQSHLQVVSALESLSRLKINSPQGQKTAQHSSQVAFQQATVGQELIQALADVTQRGEQAMVILNRRGFSSYMFCPSCKKAHTCPSCSVTTTLHQFGKKEICHYCGWKHRTRKLCPSCGSPNTIAMGLGTQRVEDEISQALPEVVIDRLDRDVLTSNTRLMGILESFKSGQSQVLVGTQMLAKGHDFPNVTLVAILFFEDGLYMPDFRSSERCLQLLLQANGRAGRGSKTGTTLVQTLSPDNDLLGYVQPGGYHSFVKKELINRNLCGYPPFYKQILVEIQHMDSQVLMRVGERMRQILVAHWQALGLPGGVIRISGPTPAPIERIANRFRAQINVLYEKKLGGKLVTPPFVIPLHALSQDKFLSKYQRLIKIDVDPLSTM